MINLSLDCPLQLLTHDCLSPTKVYKALINHFNKPDMNHNLHNFTELSNIWMGETETILGYINQINTLIKRMTSNEYQFKPTWTIHFILRGLLPSYSGIATIIHTQATVTLNFTQSALLQHKSSMLDMLATPEPSHDSLLYTAVKTLGSALPSTSAPVKGDNTGSKKKQHPCNKTQARSRPQQWQQQSQE